MTDEGPPDWNRIVDRCGERVLRIAVRILGSVHDAEEVSQEVFAEAYRLQKTRPVQCWNGLLVRLTTLRAIDRLRRTKTATELRDDDLVSIVEPFHEVTARELAQRLRNMVGELPDRQAAVFVMVHLEQLPRDQIAAILGISPEAVSTALYKARQQLLLRLSVLNDGDSR
jgi:RNA polymerase sigma-70 factor (ECF subfamily)